MIQHLLVGQLERERELLLVAAAVVVVVVVVAVAVAWVLYCLAAYCLQLQQGAGEAN